MKERERDVQDLRVYVRETFGTYVCVRERGAGPACVRKREVGNLGESGYECRQDAHLSLVNSLSAPIQPHRYET